MARRKVYERTLPGVGGRRNHSRYRIPANVMVIPLDGQQLPFWATAEDISTRGVFINARRFAAIDSVLMLKLVPRSTKPLRVKARVVHRIDGLGFGCKFIDMSAATSKTLSAMVAAASGAPLAFRRSRDTDPNGLPPVPLVRAAG